MPISIENLNKYASPNMRWDEGDVCGYKPDYYNDYCKAVELLNQSEMYIRDMELKDKINEFLSYSKDIIGI
jgi:hypothetical protein